MYFKMKLHCPYCKKIIIKDIESYLKNYPNEKWIQCCYCGSHFLKDKIKKEVTD